MIDELIEIRRYIDQVIETYKDLHPDEEGIGSTIGIASITDEEYEKQTALKRVREGYYENKFSESKREKTTGSSQGQTTLCVYGDS